LTRFLAEKAPALTQPVLCAIGAERGWTDRERELLTESGFTLCSMGTRVFRTETACTVAASLILGAMGALD
jgi:RsmE family RNA methyltransferase